MNGVIWLRGSSWVIVKKREDWCRWNEFLCWQMRIGFLEWSSCRDGRKICIDNPKDKSNSDPWTFALDLGQYVQHLVWWSLVGWQDLSHIVLLICSYCSTHHCRPMMCTWWFFFFLVFFWFFERLLLFLFFKGLLLCLWLFLFFERLLCFRLSLLWRTSSYVDFLFLFFETASTSLSSSRLLCLWFSLFWRLLLCHLLSLLILQNGLRLPCFLWLFFFFGQLLLTEASSFVTVTS